MHAFTFACQAVRVRGRCEGFPSVWNEVSYSQWDAAKRDDIRKSGGGGGFKEATGKDDTTLYVIYTDLFVYTVAAV